MSEIDDTEPVPERSPMPKRPSERLSSGIFRLATRTYGLRPSLIPAHIKRELRLVGIDTPMLARVLSKVRHIRDWPYAWEHEGDHQHSLGNHFLAAVAYYMGQKILLTSSPLKQRLYVQVLEQYSKMDVDHPYERAEVEVDGEKVVALAQFPHKASDENPVPLVLIVPGITASKEEFYPFAAPFLRRGYAIACMDNPGYGETTGVLKPGSEYYPASILEHLANDPRVDTSRLHIFGMSLGGFLALHTAREMDVASVAVVSAPYDPAQYLTRLPSTTLTAIAHMTGSHDFAALREQTVRLSLVPVTPMLRVPVKVIHGGKDRVIPLSEGRKIAGTVGGLSSLKIYPQAHHNCLEHFDDLIADMLSWFDDPYAVVAADVARGTSPERLRSIFDEDALTEGGMPFPAADDYGFGEDTVEPGIA